MQHKQIALKITNQVFRASHIYDASGDSVCCCPDGLSRRCLVNTVLTMDLPPPDNLAHVKYNTSRCSIGGRIVLPSRPRAFLLALWAVFVARELDNTLLFYLERKL